MCIGDTMDSQKSESERHQASADDNRDPNDESNQSLNDADDGSSRKWQWAPPLIEGVPPCPRGGHTATKTGGCIIMFGVAYAS